MQDFMLFIHHHWLLSLAFGITLVALIIIEFIKQKQGTGQVSPGQLTQMINHEDAVVLDVRPNQEFKDGHIIGAQSAPLAEFNDKKKKFEKLKARPIVIVCSFGQDAARAASLLNEPGLIVRTLAGGMKAWREADLPVVKD